MKYLTPVLTSIVLIASILTTSGCGSGNWEKMSIQGATVTFEMPKPIKMDEKPQQGMVVYASQNQEKKQSFKVGIIKRNYDKDQSSGKGDQEILNNFSQNMMAANQKQFQSMGIPAQFQFDGDFKVDTGIGNQFEGRAGKAFVVNRFYINKQGLYFVEATTQTENDKDVNRFLDSFKP